MIMNVAVPRDQHSLRLGQRASSHTVATPLAATTALVPPKDPKADAEVKKRLPEVEQLVVDGSLTPATAARSLVEFFVKRESRSDSSGNAQSRQRSGQ